MILEIDSAGWIAIIAALGGLVTIAGGVAVTIIIALNTGQKVDAAAARREQLADAIIDPNVTKLPPPGP